jgi:predicted small integral membrane protein
MIHSASSRLVGNNTNERAAMYMRNIKIMFVVITSLMALIYVTQNVVNSDAAHQAFMYVMSGTDHEVYPDSFGPKFTEPVFGWIAVTIIFALEYVAGFLLAKGAWDMWRARREDPGTFAASKKWAQIGCATGVLVWFGLFGVVGAAFFQMWQTAVGTGSMDGAFQLFVSCTLTLLVISQPDN